MTLITSKKTVMHPYMNPDLKFDELLEVCLLAMYGGFPVTEKVDGINYRFRLEVSAGRLNVLHSLGGGKFYTLSEYIDKGVFDDNILRVMEGVYYGCCDPAVSEKYSGCTLETELILPSNPNVVTYDYIEPVLICRRGVDSEGETFDVTPFVENFSTTWLGIFTPNKLIFNKRDGVSDEVEYVRLVRYLKGTISRCLHTTNLTGGATIGDYLYAQALKVVRKEFGYSLSNTSEELLCRRWALNDKSVRISGKSVGKRYLDKIKDMDKVARKFQDEWFFDIYVAIAKVGNYVISRYSGFLNDGVDVSYMNDRLNGLITVTQGDYKTAFSSRVLSSSGMDTLRKSTEGVVFTYGGSQYKFVGNFTWINQLLWANKKNNENK